MKSDTMSVDMSAMPPWKRELLERKRRQDEEERRRQMEEHQRMSHMPVWKRDLMLKKKRNVVFMSKSVSANDVAYTNKDKASERTGQVVKAEISTVNGSLPVVDTHMTVTVVSPGQANPRLAGGVVTEYDTSVTGCDVLDNGDTQEHLLPIHYNPWLKLDVQKNKQLSNRHSYHGYIKSNELDMANDSDLQAVGSGEVLSTSPSCNNYLDTNIQVSEHEETEITTTNDDGDSVFGEEEVAYGRGFVHKLLRRFKHMSARDEYHLALNKKSSPKRTHSSDNILDDRNPRNSSPRNHLSTGDIYDGYTSLSKQKAQSVDDLITRTKSGSFDSSSSHLSSEENLVDDSRCLSPEPQESEDYSESTNEPSPGGLLYRSSSHENILEEFPRSNIVSTARSVFESISVKGPTPEKKYPAPDPPGFRSSILSSSSSGYSAPSPLSTTHSTSVSSVESPNPDRGRSLSPVSKYDNRERSVSPVPNYTRNDAVEIVRSSQGPDIIRQSDSTPQRPSRRSYGARKPDFSPKPTITKVFDNCFRNASEDVNANHSGDDLEEIDSGVTLLSHKPRDPAQLEKDTSVYAKDTTESKPDTSSYKSHSTKSKTPNTIFSSVSSGVTATDNVPKPQENFDQTTRDHNTRNSHPVSDRKLPAHYGRSSSREEPTVSEEITLENQSAKEPENNTADYLNDVHNKSSSDRSSDVKSANIAKDSIAVLQEHRNAEANRLNLNLNLNELNRKKVVTEPSTDINRNNKSGLTNTNTTINGSSDNFPTPPLRSKRQKRPAPDGPGSLLIRPASNLIAAGTKTEYLMLNQYHDIKQGEFAPAKKRPSYYDEDSDDDVPVTNIDDYLPVTNIDDVSPAGTPREGDATQHRRAVRKYDFLNAGVVVDRSLLTKTRTKKMRINFNDSALTTFEYPSEQSLLDLMAPEPGDFDYFDPHRSKDAVRNGSVSDEEGPDYVEPSAGLLSNPGVGSAATLGSYQSKNQVDYFFGMERKEEAPVKRPQAPEPVSTDIQPAEEEDFTWSDATSSDMLF